MEIGKYLEIKWSFFTKKGANSHEQIKNFGFSRNFNNLTVPNFFFSMILRTECKTKIYANHFFPSDLVSQTANVGAVSAHIQ